MKYTKNYLCSLFVCLALFVSTAFAYDSRQSDLACIDCHESDTVDSVSASSDIPPPTVQAAAKTAFLSSSSQETWSSPENVSQTSSGSGLCSNSSRSTTVDASGNIHVVWHDKYEGYWEVYHSLKSPSGDFGQRTLISQSSGATDGRTSAYPAIASDSQGNVYVVWED